MTNSIKLSSEDSSPSPAALVKEFVAFARAAMLATSLHPATQGKAPGYPFGSVVPYDVDKQGRIVILISRLAEHYKNIVADPRASVLIIDPFGVEDPQRFARATLTGDFKVIGPEEQTHVEQSFWTRFPEAPERAIAHDFIFYRLEPRSIRWIGGFGDIRWIPVSAYAECPFDPIAYLGHEIVTHMNDDHVGAIGELLRYFAKPKVKFTRAEMIAVCGRSFIVQAREGEKLSRYEINFPYRAETSEEVRTMLITMLRTARDASAC